MSQRSRPNLRYDLRNQLPRLIFSGGCLIGSLVLLGMFFVIAWRLFLRINPPPIIVEMAETTESVGAEPEASVSLTRTPFVVNIGGDDSDETAGSAAYPPPDSATSTPVPEPTVNLLSDGIGGGGGLLAYVSDEYGNFEVVTSRPDGTEKLRITDNWFGDWRPVWSPDASKILFHTKRDGNWEIYVMNADGSGMVNLTNNLSEDSFGQWSPDGTQIVYQTNREGDFDNYIMNADGSDQRNYIGSSVWNEYGPQWSPDGTKLLFTRRLDDSIGREIFVINTDGTGEVQLTDAPNSSYFPQWSPDGTQIAFHSNRANNYEIFLMNADGSDVRQLTNNEIDDFFPAFSPDGNWLAYHANITGGEEGNRNIFLISVDGLREQQLTTLEGEERMPFWQP